MFSFYRHFPIIELMFSNSPIAFVITKNKQIKIHKIKPILGKFFLTDEGFFTLDPSKSLGIFKQRVYLYDASNINPLPATKLLELEKLEKLKDYDTFMERYNNIVNDDDNDDDNDDNPQDQNKIKSDETTTMQNPIDPTIMRTLNDWGACDPQLFAVGTNHLLVMEKLMKKRSGALVTKIPLTLIIVGILITFLMLIFGPQIMDSLNEGIGSMFSS